jgi:hypothetical protein
MPTFPRLAHQAQETQAQETQAQETQTQETQAQETQAQETQAQETQAQETQAQETQAQETQAQETQAQETQAQETQAQETQAQETVRGQRKNRQIKEDRGVRSAVPARVPALALAAVNLNIRAQPKNKGGKAEWKSFLTLTPRVRHSTSGSILRATTRTWMRQRRKQ